LSTSDFDDTTSDRGLSKDIFLFSPHGKSAYIEVYYSTGTFDRENVRCIKDSESDELIYIDNGIFTCPSGFFDPMSGKNIMFTIAQV